MTPQVNWNTNAKEFVPQRNPREVVLTANKVDLLKAENERKHCLYWSLKKDACPFNPCNGLHGRVEVRIYEPKFPVICYYDYFEGNCPNENTCQLIHRIDMDFKFVPTE